MALSMVMCEHLPLLELLREVIDNKVDTTFQPATIHCKAFEDNSRAVKMAKLPKLHPQTNMSTTIIIISGNTSKWMMCKL